MSSRIKFIIAALFLFLPLLLHGILTGRAALDIWAAQPCVLVVGPVRSVNSFSSQVWTGMQAADLDGNLAIPYKLLSLDQYSAGEPASWKNKLLRIIATNNVCAIVSCQNSPEVPQLLSITAPLKIPVLLTVATDDDLMSLSPTTTLRLPPSNSKQAVTLVGKASQYASVALLYEANNYGRGLAANVKGLLREHAIPTFEFVLQRDVEVTPYLQFLIEYNCQCVIFAGYYGRVLDVITKLNALRFNGVILLTDGCYSPSLITASWDSIEVSICFPVELISNSTGAHNGYADYGHDAAVLLAMAINRREAGKSNTENLLNEVKYVARTLNKTTDVGTKPLRQDYDFDGRGENREGRFRLWRLGKTN